MLTFCFTLHLSSLNNYFFILYLIFFLDSFLSHRHDQVGIPTPLTLVRDRTTLHWTIGHRSYPGQWNIMYHIQSAQYHSASPGLSPLLLISFITKYVNVKSRAYIALAFQICTTTVSCGQPTLHVHPCPPPTAKFLWNCYSVPTVSL